MASFDLRGQNKLLRRVLFLLVPTLVAFADLTWRVPPLPRSMPVLAHDTIGAYGSALAGSVFIVTTGFILLGIAAGVGVPDLWMRATDRHRRELLRGTAALNVVGWLWLASWGLGVS